jgi:hypothetical protein
LKNGQYKGLFGEIKNNDGLYSEVAVLTTQAVVLLDRDEYVVVDDIVDYKYSKEDLIIKVLYGSISYMPTKKEILIGFGMVSIINNDSGTCHDVSSFNIICKHKDGEVPEIPEEKHLCKVCNFVSDLKSIGFWDFEKYVLGEKTFIAYNELNNMSYFHEDGLWYYKNQDFESYGSKLIELDEKLLKGYILALKNNPSYFKADGYKYYFFDKIGLFLKSLIEENKICFLNSTASLAPISENKIMMFDGMIITVGDSYIDFTSKSINFSIHILNSLVNQILEKSITYVDINNDKVEEFILKPFIGFVNLLK